MNLPRRVFLDTNVVNFIVDHDSYIFEGEDDGISNLSPRDRADREALRLVFETGQRAHWEMVVSDVTYAEILATADEHRRSVLLWLFQELWAYWRGCFAEDGALCDTYAN